MISASELRHLHATACTNAYNQAPTPAITEELLSTLRSDYASYPSDERLLVTELHCAWAYSAQEAQGIVRALRMLSKMRKHVATHAERALLYLNSGIEHLVLRQADHALDPCNKAYSTFASTGQHNGDATLALLYVAQARLLMSCKDTTQPEHDLKQVVDFSRTTNTGVFAEHWVLALAWLSFIESLRKRQRQSSRYIDRALRVLEENEQLVHNPALRNNLLAFQHVPFDERQRHVQLITVHPPQFQLLKL